MTDKKLTDKGEQIREKMIEITAKILREKGFKKTTVRAIAAKAHVNIASVRYYFGTKEELISCALEYMVSHLETIISYLDDVRLTPKERLKRYMIAYFHMAQSYPALYRSITKPSSKEAKDTYFIYLSFLHSQCWDKVMENVSAITGYTEKEDLELKCMQLFAAVEFPIILISNKKDSFVANYMSEKTIERYVDILLETTEDKKIKNQYLNEILQGAK